MGSVWDVETTATFVAAVIGAVVAVASIVTTMVEGRATRRRVALDSHRDQWWARWSWIAEKALSQHPAEEQAAMVMLDALTELPWRTRDDMHVALAVSRARTRRERPHDDHL